jgi:hypothetical protein
MSDNNPDLITEQLNHSFDLIKAEIASIKSDTSHITDKFEIRLCRLEEITKDHEQRLRSLQDSSTHFKVLASLATGGGFLSVISLMRELFK